MPVENLPVDAECCFARLEKIEDTPNVGLALWIRAAGFPSNLQLVAVDRAGKAHTANGYSSYASGEKLSPWGSEQTRMTFDKLRLQDVKALRFEGRREEYAQFDNL